MEIGRRAGIPVQISHQSLLGSDYWRRVDEVFAIIEAGRRDEVDVTYDLHPYIAAATPPSQLLPEWTQDGGVAPMVERLRAPAERARIKEGLREGWFRGLGWEWDKIVVAALHTEANRAAVGRSLAQIAQERRADPLDVLLDLTADEENQMEVLIFHRHEDDIRDLMTHPLAMIASDGNAIAPDGPLAGARPHPRFYGTFPRVLGHYVRDERLMPLETAVYKMTGLPARRLGLSDRGVVAVGQAADLVVFDPEAIADRATYEAPHQFPVGISHVLVNGVPVLADGEHTRQRPGQLLRRA